MHAPRTRSLERFRLDGLRALITGAGRGLGKACAVALADAGAEVVIMSRTASELENLRDQIKNDGGKAEIAVCNAANADQINEIIPDLGRLDILVNNAGTNIPEAFTEVSAANFDAIALSSKLFSSATSFAAPAVSAAVCIEIFFVIKLFLHCANACS